MKRPSTYVGFALDEIARRRLKRARRAAGLAALEKDLHEGVVVRMPEKPYPQSPLASRRVFDQEDEADE